MIILGINGLILNDANGETEDDIWTHGSSATLIQDGVWKGSSGEERFTRIKYDGNFPVNSINKLLVNNNLRVGDVDIVSFTTSCNDNTFNPIYMSRLKFFLQEYFTKAKIFFSNHHESHAMSSFLTSPFEESSILTLDATGDRLISKEETLGNCGCYGFAKKTPFQFAKLDSYYTSYKNNGLGEFYSVLCDIILKLKFHDNPKKYNDSNKNSFKEGRCGKVMGLSAFGKPINLSKQIFKIEQFSKYEMPKISSLQNVYSFEFLNEVGNYSPEDLALWTQTVFENTILDYLDKIPNSMKMDNLCFGGGCALNISLNSKIISEGIFKDVHISSAPSDDGLSLGGALLVAKEHNIDVVVPQNIGCVGLSYESSFNTLNQILTTLNVKEDLEVYEVDDQKLYDDVSTFLLKNNIVAWFQGKSEFGPRALCNRSILSNPSHNNKQLLNEKVKFRESWRPYAAVIMSEFLDEWFICPKKDSDYMLFNSVVKKEKSAIIPGVVHNDSTCRIQTVNSNNNLKAYNLLSAFYKKSKIPLLLNTSFNTIPGEPIVETPEDAVKSFLYSDIDVLVIGNNIITKRAINGKVNYS